MPWLDVDLEEDLTFGVEQGRVLVGGVGGAELGADGEHEVGVCHGDVGGFKAEVAEDAERQGMCLREGALARGGGGDGGAEEFGQLKQARLGGAHADAVAGDNNRLRSTGKRFDGSRNVIGGGALALRGQVLLSGVETRRRVGAYGCREGGAVEEQRSGPGWPVVACFSASWVLWTADAASRATKTSLV